MVERSVAILGGQLVLMGSRAGLRACLGEIKKNSSGQHRSDNLLRDKGL